MLGVSSDIRVPIGESGRPIVSLISVGPVGAVTLICLRLWWDYARNDGGSTVEDSHVLLMLMLSA